MRARTTGRGSPAQAPRPALTRARGQSARAPIPVARVSAPYRGSSEGGYASRLFRNDPGIVHITGSGNITVDYHLRTRPHRQPRAAAAAFLVAHDIAPFRAVDETMAVSEWRHRFV